MSRALGSCLCACSVLLICTAARADIIYEVDFENPPHVVGSPPATGSGPDRPTTVDLVAVSDSVAAFPTQSAFFDSTAGFAGMSFNPGPVFSTGIHLISWDIVMLSVMGPDDPQAFVNIPATSGAQAFAVEFYLNGDIVINDALNGSSIVSSYTLEQADAFGFLFDMDADTYDLLINGSPVVSDAPMQPTRDLFYVSFTGGRFGENTFAIDNFQWQIIPEPSTIALMLLALGGLAVGRCRR